MRRASLRGATTRDLPIPCVDVQPLRKLRLLAAADGACALTAFVEPEARPRRRGCRAGISLRGSAHTAPELWFNSEHSCLGCRRIIAEASMGWSKRGLAYAAAAIGAIGLLSGATALAQEDSPPKASLREKAAVLDDTFAVRSEGNDESAEVQKQIDDVSDEIDDLLAQYRIALKQTESIRIYNQQMRDLIASQEAELASLVDQLARIQGVGRSVTPLMLRMIEAIEKFVALDVPFLIEERTERIAELRRMMARADVTNAGKYRQVMEAYQIETSCASAESRSCTSPSTRPTPGCGTSGPVRGIPSTRAIARPSARGCGSRASRPHRT